MTVMILDVIRVKQAREYAGLTPKEACDRINEKLKKELKSLFDPWEPHTVIFCEDSNMAEGRYDHHEAEALAHAYGVSLAYLQGSEELPPLPRRHEAVMATRRKYQ